MEDVQAAQRQNDERRVRNLRTGLILASVALAFFIGVIVKFYWLGR
jgi:hypothetical protein